MDICLHDYKIDCECELSEAQREREAGIWLEGMETAFDNVLEELQEMHFSKAQFNHLVKRSNVCGTCRMIAIVESHYDDLQR